MAQSHRPKFRPPALKVTAAAALSVLSGLPVQAQEVQQVTVTGIRRAIENAITVKREAGNIVEAISSEDLGKLPDPSVADSIARLPGIAAQRNKGSGKAQQISVRGMSPDFNGGLLNGREVASSGDSRGVDFDMYPSELLSGVTVHKTPHAGLLGQGLSSTIDLHTVRPLNLSGRQIAVNWRDQRTGIDNGVPNGEGTGERMSFAYVDQFMNKTVGVAFGAVKFREAGAAQLRKNTWGGWTVNTNYNGQQVGVPGGFGRDLEYSDQSREGLMGVLQWKPNKDFETVLDVFQSKGRSAAFKKGIEGHLGASTDPHNYRGVPVLTNATIVNGVAQSGTLSNFKGVIRNHNEGADDELNAWGLNSRLKLGAWKLEGDVGQSKVIKESARFETTGGLVGNGNPTQSQGAPFNPAAVGTVSWTGFTGSNHGDLVFTPSTNFADRNAVKLTDVMGWGGGINSPQAGYVASPKVTDEIENFRVSGKRDLGWGPLGTIEFGLAHVNREKVATTREGFLVINGSTDPFAATNFPGSGTAVVDGIAIATWDPRGSLGSVYSLRSNNYGAVINRNWGVEEKVTTGFVKADLDGKLFGFDYSGNAGLQFVRTQQNSSGFINDSGRCLGSTPDTCVTQKGGKSYNDVLPSVNLALEIRNDLVARFGLGKTMSRPNMSQMRASIDAPSVPTTPPLNDRIVSSGGNPEVEPFRATALDLSVEKYFSKNKGYVSAAYFYKDIETYILTLPQRFDFAGRLPTNFVLPSQGTVGILNRPTNGSGGNIRGFEFAVNLPLSMLAAPLEGFGISVNHSDTKSSIQINSNQLPFLDPGITFSIPLPGLSRRVTNTRLYYERFGFQVAIAERKRSDFLGEIKDYKDDTQVTFIRGESVIDLQVGYTFPDRTMLKGLSLLFQANNINDAKFQQYTSDRNNPTDTKRYGKTYLFGANYKF